MTHALNLTLPLKQDDASQAKLKELAAAFAEHVQPVIAEAMRRSEIVHNARVNVIDNKYIQVITEFDGTYQEYAEFFRRELTPIFAKIFELAEGAPDVTDGNAFFMYSMKHNLRSLGTTVADARGFDGELEGFLFSAYDHADVRKIKAALAAQAQQPE